MSVVNKFDKIDDLLKRCDKFQTTLNGFEFLNLNDGVNAPDYIETSSCNWRIFKNQILSLDQILGSYKSIDELKNIVERTERIDEEVLSDIIVALNELKTEIEIKNRKEETIINLTNQNEESENRYKSEKIRADIAEKKYKIKDNNTNLKDIENNITEVNCKIQEETIKVEKSAKTANRIFLLLIILVILIIIFIMKLLKNIYLANKDFIDYILLTCTCISILFPWIIRITKIDESIVYKSILKQLIKYFDKHYKIDYPIIEHLNSEKDTIIQEKEQLERENQVLQAEIEELENQRQIITV